jgi:putative peptidoglycan lipid II flippase
LSKAIGVASLLYGVSILLSRLVGLVRESVIGRTLGAGLEADLYKASFIIPDFLNYLLAGGVLSLVFIPIFQAHLARDDEAAGWRAFSVIANTLLVLVLAATAVLWIAAPTLVGWVFPGFSSEGQVALTGLVRIVLPAQIFHLVGGLISATLQARDKHAMPAFAPLVYTGCIVAGGLIGGASSGAEGFSWGVLVGSVLGPFGLPLLGAMKHGLHWDLRAFEPRHPDFKRYFLLSLPVMLGFSVVALDDGVIKHYASSLAEGTVAQLDYARNLMKVPMGVFGLAAGMAAFPTLSRLMAAGQRAEALSTLVKALRMMLLLAIAAQAALTVCAGEVAEVIWGTARFSSQQLADIGLYTGVLCLGLWAWSAQMLVARGFYAQQNTWTPTILGSVVLAVAFPFYGLAQAQWGAVGLAVASSATISVYLLGLLFLLRRTFKGEQAEGPGLVDAFARLIPALVLAVLAGRGLAQVLPELPALIRGGLTGTTALAVFLGVTLALRMPESGALVLKVRRKVLRR